MTITLGFDVYGTLIDTQGILAELEKRVGDKAAAFSQIWRDKQLEYSFRRGLMQNYENFAVVTRNALDYTGLYLKQSLSDTDKQALMAAYKVLPAFDDVRACLEQARDADFKLYAFSNGSQEAVEGLLVAAGIRELFHGVVSVDSIKSFKPNPGVYSHFLRETGSTGGEAWLISSNPFDVIGAISAGMRAAWIQRNPEMVFDPWGIDPTLSLPSLSTLADQIKQNGKEQ
ncbi:MAG: haloacid dehalogenase type II [Rhodospirillales bacterium]|nr:haloacid dehalogenase type II [Rhodospirillales bacterium]